MSKLQITSYLSGILISILIISSASAATVNLDFSSLPSNQDWSFVKSTGGSHANDTEAGTFSLNSGILTGNTIGSGLVSPSGLAYQQIGIVDPNMDWTLSWTMKITGYEQGGSDNNYGAWFGVYNGTSVVGVALSDSELTVQQSGTATGKGWYSSARYGATSIDKAFDTMDDFHTYAISYVADGITGFGDFVLSIDGVDSLTGRSLASSADYISFGDGTGDANASWELSHYKFDQAASSVPIPGAFLLFGSGLLALMGLKRRE